jgi:hypothetical protein
VARRLDLLHDGGNGGVATLPAQVEAQVGDEIDLAVLELAGRLAEHVLDGIERAGDVGVAVRQLERVQFGGDLARVLGRFGNDSPAEVAHEDDAEGIAARRLGNDLFRDFFARSNAVRSPCFAAMLKEPSTTITL